MKRASVRSAVVFCVTIQSAAMAGGPLSIDWVTQFGTNQVDSANSVALDALGNVFVTGDTRGNLGGQTNLGFEDAFLSKFDSSGSMLWTRLISTNNTESGEAVAVDAAGNAYVAGRTAGNLAGSAGNWDAFVRKISPTGATLWTRQFGTATDDQAFDLKVDNGGNVYVSGFTTGNLGGQTALGDYDGFVRKLDSNGNHQWTRLIGTSSSDQSFGMSLDQTGNVFVTGFSWGNMDGQTGNGQRDAFITKMNGSGVTEWTRLVGGLGEDVAAGIATDLGGNVYVAGHSNRTVNGQPHSGNYDALLSKYDENGAPLWTRLLGTVSADFAYDVAVDSAGNVTVSGSTEGSLGGPNQGSEDIFLARWSEFGDLQWIQQFGAGGRDKGLGVITDIVGNVYMTGSVGGSAFGPGAGNTDAFIVKLIPEPSALLILTVCGLVLSRRRLHVG